MFCTNCGNEVESYARFCSKCGKEVFGVAVPEAAEPPARKKHDMGMHVNILGSTFMGFGALIGLAGIAIIFAGQIAPHMPISRTPDFPMMLVHFAGWITGVVGLAILAIAAGIAAAGAGLVQYRGWARVLAAVMSVFML